MCSLRTTRHTMLARCVVCIVASVALAQNANGQSSWKAATNKTIITPEQPMWMSGYSSRDHVAEGKLHDLWVKALVLEDPAGTRVALVTLDLVGIDRQMSLVIRNALQERYGLARQQIALCCSHTHTGPVVGQNLRTMYFLDPQQARQIDEYMAHLEKKVVDVVGRAIASLAPAQISWGSGRATFAVNRRNNPEPEVPALAAAGKLRGPVDHDVPVLAVRGADGKLSAIAFGYACHATTLSFYQWSGDWPGFAQLALEAAHPDCTVLFWAGCGADQNPLPRRTVELAESYGRQAAEAVDQALKDGMAPISGRLASQYAEIDLAFDRLPDQAELQAQAQSQDKYAAARAKMLLKQIEEGQPLSQAYPYPVLTWQLGTGPTWILLGGEVVVDFALRFKAELAPLPVWVAGYTNDVMAYIPSRRVLAEGGYEGASAMAYYGLPTSWSQAVEETIVREVRRQAALVQKTAAD